MKMVKLLGQITSNEYDAFEQEKLKCKTCSIFENYKCIVPSEGNKSHPIFVIIGEAPGADEIKERRPFVGKAGQLLREHLRELGFNRKNTLITNVIPCRPLNNKFPNSGDDLQHVQECAKQWLYQELCILQPDLLILLGNSPLRHVLGETGITKLRGKAVISDQFGKRMVCIPTYHPSYVMRKQHMAEGKQIIENFHRDLSFAMSRHKKAPQ